MSVYRHKISDEFDNEWNLPSNSRVTGPERLNIAVFNLVSAIESTFLNQSGQKLHTVSMGIRSRMSSIMSEIRLETWKLFTLELLKIAVLNLVSAMETWFLNQAGPKLHKWFIGTSSRKILIMSEIRLVIWELLAERLKLLFFKLVWVIDTTFLNQSGPKLHKVFIGKRSRMRLIMSEIRLVTWELLALKVKNCCF